MEALSSSVSSIKIPTIQHQPSFYHYFKTPFPYSHLQNVPHLSSSNSIKKLPNSIPNNPHASTTNSSHTQVLKKPHFSPLQTRPATGYATALIEIAKLDNSLQLESVSGSVRKLKKWLKNEQIRSIMGDPFMDESNKGEILKEMAEKGRLNKHLVTLVKVLVEKGKVGIVGEVLGEFERIYDELCGTQVVLVSCDRKLEKEEAFGIASRVQKISGALKVKVMSLVANGSLVPSLAM